MAKKKFNLEDSAKAIQSWEEGMGHLGKCLVEFQRIEETLSMCISAMVGRNHRIGEIITCEMSFRARVAVFAALFTELLEKPKLPKDVDDFIKKIYWAEQERNTLTHSVWDASPNEPESIVRSKRAIRKKIYSRVSENYSPDDLFELTEIFEGICTDLWYFTSKYLPKVGRRL